MEEGLVIDHEQFIMNMDDEAFWKHAVNEYIKTNRGKTKADLKKVLANGIEVDSLNKMKFAFDSLYTAITLPMEQVKVNKYVSWFVVRPLQVIASPFLLTAVAIGELAELTAIGGFVTAVVADLALYYSLLAVFNLPIYAYDFAQGIVNYFSGSKESNKNSNGMGQLLLEWKPSTEVPEQKPGHYPSPVRTPQDRAAHQAQADLDCTQPDNTSATHTF